MILNIVLPKVPELSQHIDNISKAQTLLTAIEEVKNLNSIINECLDYFQNEGLANNGLIICPPLEVTLKTESWVKVIELFLPAEILHKDRFPSIWNDAIRRFISNYKDQSKILLFCINSDGREISLMFNSNDTNSSTIIDGLQRFFPGITLVEKHFFIPNFNFKKYLGGVPSTVNEQSVFLPIDNFLTALYGQKFTLLIKMTPLNENLINALVSNLEKYLDFFKTINDLNLMVGAGTGSRNQLTMKFERESSLHLIELLSKDIERCKVGTIHGLWTSEAILFSDNKSCLEKNSSLTISIFGGEKSFPMRIQTRDQSFQTILTSKEVASYISFPTKEIPGLSIKPIYSFGTNISISPNGKNRIHLGKILYNMQPTQNDYSLDVDILKKHLFIAGVTGSGKTTTVKKIINELQGLDSKIPFLIIEPVKSEYGKYIKSIAGCYIDVGVDDFRINLFQPAVKNTSIISHVDYLRAVFAASFVLYPPMPYVLETAIYEAYKYKGFRFDKYDNSLTIYPSIHDLIENITKVVRDSGYSDRLRDDIVASLNVRLQNLLMGFKGNIFGEKYTLPKWSDIMSQPTVINLNRIVDDEQKALIISMILAYIYEYRENHGEKDTLQHVTIIEEAHRLLSKTASNSGNIDSANPKAHAIEFFCNLLSEIRAYGEGLIIAEQIPTKLIGDVIKNTGSKIIHKLIAYDDKMIMGHSMNFEEEQEKFFTLLNPERGQAIVFSENTNKPIIIEVERFDKK